MLREREEESRNSVDQFGFLFHTGSRIRPIKFGRFPKISETSVNKVTRTGAQNTVGRSCMAAQQKTNGSHERSKANELSS